MPTIERISVGLDGSDGNGDSRSADLSPDGRFVAFVSAATNLVADDTNGVTDIFVRDRQTGVMERVSTAADGTEANGASGVFDVNALLPDEPPAVSADGKLVVFASAASNLVGGDGNGVRDVFLVNRQADTIDRLSASRLGQSEDGPSSAPTMNPDGRFVAFTSAADNLVAGDGNGEADVFLVDLADQSGLTRISAGARELGLDVVDVGAGAPAISTDGRFIVFGVGGKQLGALTTDGDRSAIPTTPNVEVGTFVYDRLTGKTTFLGRETTYTETDFLEPVSTRPAISGDGGTIAFVNGRVDVESGGFGADTYPEATVVDRVTGEESTTVHHLYVPTYYDAPTPIDALSLSEDGSALALVRVVGLRGPGAEAEIVDLETDFTPQIQVPTTGNVDSSTRLSDDGTILVYGTQTQGRFSPPEGPSQLELQTFPGGPDFGQPAAVEAQAFAGKPIVGDNLAILEGSDVRITYLDEVAKYQSSLGAYLVDADGRFSATEIVFARIEDADTASGLPADVRPGGGPLRSGDSLLLSSLFDQSDLEEAVQFGLFLVADGANLNPAASLDPTQGSWRFVDEQVGTFPEAGIDTFVPTLLFDPASGGPSQRVVGDIFHTTDLGSPLSPALGLNPDRADHTVLGARDGGLEVRFEDLRVLDADRLTPTGDRDFNDLTILLTREPAVGA